MEWVFFPPVDETLDELGLTPAQRSKISDKTVLTDINLVMLSEIEHGSHVCIAICVILGRDQIDNFSK